MAFGLLDDGNGAAAPPPGSRTGSRSTGGATAAPEPSEPAPRRSARAPAARPAKYGQWTARDGRYVDEDALSDGGEDIGEGDGGDADRDVAVGDVERDDVRPGEADPDDDDDEQDGPPDLCASSDDESGSNAGVEDPGAYGDGDRVDEDSRDQNEEDEDEDEEDAGEEDDEEDDEGDAPGSKRSKKSTKKLKAKSKKLKADYVVVGVSPDAVVFAIDGETSGPKKRTDGFVALAVVACDIHGKELAGGRWSGLFQPRGGEKGLDYNAIKCHGLTWETLRRYPLIGARLPSLITFFERMVRGYKTGILVAHNGNGCDFPYLAVELARAKLTLPDSVAWYTCDTYYAIKNRFKNLYPSDPPSWPVRTEAGNPKRSVEAIVDYCLKTRPSLIAEHGEDASFANTFGAAHDAMADALGHSVIYFDALQTKLQRGLCQEFGPFILAAEETLQGPVVTHAPPLPGWTERVVPPDATPTAPPAPTAAPPPAPAPRCPPTRSVAAAPAPPPGDSPPPPTPPTSSPDAYVDTPEAQAERDAAFVEGKKRFGPRFAPGVGRDEGPTRPLKVFLRDAARQSAAAPGALLLKLFYWWFDDDLLGFIASASDAYASVDVVHVKDSRGKNVIRPPQPDDAASIPRRPRRRDWEPLTVPELKVFLGIAIYAGAHPRRRYGLYWDTSGQGHDDQHVAAAMKKNRYAPSSFPFPRDLPQAFETKTLRRFFEIYAMLTFMMPDDEENLDDRLRKIRQVDDALLRKTKEAFVAGQFLCFDEMMLRCLSSFCKFKQFMPLKPIKCGIKAWGMADAASGYLLSWEYFLGSDGLPDMVLRLFDRFLTDDYSNAGHVLICDNYFTSHRLFAELLDRGIYAVGTSKHTRPKNDASAKQHSWPLSEYSNTDATHLSRGFMRTVSKDVDGGTICATVWLDNKFVKLLYTSFLAEQAFYVLRYDKGLRARLLCPAPLAISVYTKYMGAIDRVDKDVAYFDIGFPQCQRRYHRRIFEWLLSQIFHNIVVLFGMFYNGDHDEYRRKLDKGRGYKTDLQTMLGLALIRDGTREAFAQLTPAQMVARETPAFAPKAPGPKPALFSPVSTAKKKTCVYAHHENITLEYDDNRHPSRHLPRSTCANCSSKSVRPESGKGRSIMPDGSAIPKPYWGCKGCKVILCNDCFDEWDHSTNAPSPTHSGPSALITICATTLKVASP